MSDVKAFIRMSPSEKELLRPSIRSAIEALLDEQTEEWRETFDIDKICPKRVCDFCRQPKQLHPSDGSELCSECDPVQEHPPTIQCFICRQNKYIRYNVGPHPVCKECGWPKHKIGNCSCFTCKTPNLPITWYNGLLDYYVSKYE